MFQKPLVMFHVACRRKARLSPSGEKPVAKPLGRLGIGDRFDRFGHLGNGPRHRRSGPKRLQSRLADPVDQDVHADGRQEANHRRPTDAPFASGPFRRTRIQPSRSLGGQFVFHRAEHLRPHGRGRAARCDFAQELFDVVVHDSSSRMKDRRRPRAVR